MMKEENPKERVLHLRTVDSVDSTNSALCRLARAGGGEGEVLIARRQTAGKGRLGRSFYSPEGTGVYCSILLRPTLPASLMPRLTSAAAVAISEAIAAVYGIETQIKWVNDLYYRRRKVCGILTESAFESGSDRLAYAVVGFGINLLPPPGGFPPELAALAGALFESEDALANASAKCAKSTDPVDSTTTASSDTTVNPATTASSATTVETATTVEIAPKSEIGSWSDFSTQEEGMALFAPSVRLLVREAVERFFAYYDRLAEGIHLPAYRSRCFLRGEQVTYLRGSERFTATVLDIDEEANIVLQNKDGEVLRFGSGEISLHEGLS